MRCRLALLHVLLLGALTPACSEPGPPRNAVVLLIDTLRADAIEQAATPSLDALAARGEQVEIAWSASTWTVPSVLSLLTGSHVREHGWDHVLERAPLHVIAPRPTLASVLAEQGFTTVGLFGNPILKLPVGWASGFESFRHVEDPALPEAVAAEVSGWADDRRHFLYVHLMGPHEPLLPSEAARLRHGISDALPEGGLTIDWAREERSPEEQLRARLLYRRAYLAALEDTDLLVGEILETLEPFLHETVLVFTSDHGEMLGERDRYGHAHWLDEPLTRVPFVGIHTGELPRFLNGAAVPDLVTRALGVTHTWSVRAGDPSPLVSQRFGKLALSPDGATKGVWGRKGRLRVFDIRGYPEPQGGRGEEAQRRSLQAARGAFRSRVPEGQALTRDELADDAMIEALRQIGYVVGDGDGDGEPEDD